MLVTFPSPPRPTIKDMAIGDIRYTVSWAVVLNPEMTQVWVDTIMTADHVKMGSSGTVTVKIKRGENAFYVCREDIEGELVQTQDDKLRIAMGDRYAPALLVDEIKKDK